MKKKELLSLRKLYATPCMMRTAAEDIPKKRTFSYWGGTYTAEASKFDLFMRCALIGDILKVALYQPKSMRLGSRKPAFELFIDREERTFLTYDYEKKRWLTAKLDRLEWQQQYQTGATRWISDKDAKTVMSYLGTETGDYWGILKYQREIRSDELKERHRKETDPWDADLTQTPAVPKDWERWVAKVGIDEHFIYYDYKRGGAKTGYCTYCEKDVPIRKPRHNKEGRCPCCRKKITFKSAGRAGTVDTATHWVYLMQRCKDGFMIRFYEASRRYRKSEYKTPVQYCFEIRRAIYSPYGKPLRTYFKGLYRNTVHRWIQCNNYSPGWWDYAGRLYGKTMPDLAKRGLCRTGFMEFWKEKQIVDPERYFAALKRVPQLELFSKANLPVLRDECLKSTHEYESCLHDRNGNSLVEMMGIDAQQLKRLRDSNRGVEYLRWLQYEKSTGKAIPDDVIRWFCTENVSLRDISFIKDRMSIVQIYNYIRRNMKQENMKLREVITTWADYLSMAEKFKMDTSDELVYRTNKLRLRHDELVARAESESTALQAAEVLEQFPHINAICTSLKDKYEYAGKKYVILAPKSAQEIIEEGKVLHHCIAKSDRDWERMEQHESYLLFLRKAKEPSQAYYTMEIEPDGTVRQIRTYYDVQNKDINRAREFLREWQEVIRGRLTDDDRTKARKSRELREQEFIQLRNDQVKIHTGHLAGRLLVEVLTADLMENIAA